MVAVIYKPGRLQVLGVCDGPDGEGRCPRAGVDGRAFCAGCDIVLSRDEPAGESFGLARRFRVYEETTRCPLATPVVGLRFVHADRGYFSPFTTSLSATRR